LSTIAPRALAPFSVRQTRPTTWLRFPGLVRFDLLLEATATPATATPATPGTATPATSTPEREGRGRR
jgi:hypothetical protein